MIDPHAATADVAETSEPTVVDREAIKALVGSALGYAMDGFDLLILGFMLKFISADLSLTQTQADEILSNSRVQTDPSGARFISITPFAVVPAPATMLFASVVFAVFSGLRQTPLLGSNSGANM